MVGPTAMALMGLARTDDLMVFWLSTEHSGGVEKDGAPENLSDFIEICRVFYTVPFV